MSASMRWLAVVQFCSWFTLFAVFVYSDARRGQAALRRRALPGTPGYEAGANWVGVLFATYNGLGVLAALIIPSFVRRFGLRMSAPGQSLAGRRGPAVDAADPRSRLAAGLRWSASGFAWASIIALPYAMLANNLPSRKMGVNIGIFNIFIVIPQLLALRACWARCSTCSPTATRPLRFVIGAVGWFLAGLAVLRVRETT